MLIVLLNFLIAVISTSYEETMETSEIFQYQTKASMNTEALIHKKQLEISSSNKDTFLGFCILSEANSCEPEAAGMAAKIKQNTAEQIDNLKSDLIKEMKKLMAQNNKENKVDEPL